MKATLPGRFRPAVASALALVFSLVVHAGPAAAMRAVSGPLGPSVFGLSWSTAPATPCDGQDVRLLFTVCECQVDLVSATRDSVGPILIRLRVHPDILCVRCVPDTHAVDLGALRAGAYAFNTRIEVEYTAPPDSTWPIGPFQEPIEFMVGRVCGPGNGVPFLERVVIGTPPCPTCPPRVCPNDSIDVFLEGTFPTNCMHLADIKLSVPLSTDPNGDPFPRPYGIGLFYGVSTACDSIPCNAVTTPWEAHVRLPGLPHLSGFTYQLPIVALQQAYCNGVYGPPELIGQDEFPFVVADACTTGGPPIACYNVAWSHQPGPTICDAYYGKTQQTRLVFKVGAAVPISGIQGKFRLDTPALHIAGVGVARDNWAVQTSTDPNTGEVSFVAFAGSSGAAIPPTPTGIPQDLLTVSVATNLRGELPDQARLAAVELLVSDVGGQAVLPCPVITLEDPPPWVAILCAAPSKCDANGDQLADVRDLVTMINCLYPPPDWQLDCADSSGTLDCDDNGQFGIEDVFCCAQAMLGGDQPVPTPDSLRATPDLALRFGLPRDLGGGALEVPLDVSGLDLAGAARFDVAYPDTRYTLEAVTFTGFATNWWAMSVLDVDRARVMLLDLGSMNGATPRTTGASGGTVLLKLRLRDGASAGGELTISACDFAGSDGIRLTTPNAGPRLALGTVGRLALALPRPNPFRAGTSLTLTLPVAGALDAAVYNAAGRRVATLKKEPNLDPGVYELTWDGKDDAGSRAAGGVYFVRVVTAAGGTAQKLLFLPDGGR